MFAAAPSLAPSCASFSGASIVLLAFANLQFASAGPLLSASSSSFLLGVGASFAFPSASAQVVGHVAIPDQQFTQVLDHEGRLSVYDLI